MAVRRSLFVALLVALGFHLVPTTAQAEGTKFATVDMARVLREYEQVKRVAQKLQRQKDEFQEEIDKKQQEIKNINEELQGAKDAAKKSELEKKKRARLTALQNQFAKLKEKLGQMEKEEFDAIKNQIYNEIDKLASQKGVAMILEKQWLYYPRNTEDLTEELLSTLGTSGGSGGSKKAPKQQAPASSGEEE